MKKLGLVLMVVALGMFLLAGNAIASILPVLPPVSYPVRGESELTGGGYTVYIDWVVYGTGTLPSSISAIGNWYTAEGSLSDVTGNYIYLYQLENKDVPSDGIDEFNIAPFSAATVTGIGWINSYNLDTDHSLAGEYEPGSSTLDDVYSANLDIFFARAEWGFELSADKGVPADTETEAMWMISSAPPNYYPAEANNGVELEKDPVPAPVPEPTSMLLFGMGILGLFGFRRKVLV